MQISGILPALVTPLDEKGKFLTESLAVLLERCYQSGIHGVYVGGQTGEGLLQSIAMRAEVIGAAVEGSPAGKSVVAHVGCGSTADAVTLAQHAAKLGAHAISSLPPSEAGSFAEVKQYFVDLAAATDLPLLVYHFPDRSPLASTHQALTELLEIPNVVGIKFTDYNLYTLSRLKQLGTSVLNGRDEILAAGLLMGADGGIGSFYNLVPGMFVEIYDQTRGGDWSGARKSQDRINELIEITLRFPMLAAIKMMLTWSGIPCGGPIPPHAALTPQQESALREALVQAEFSPDGFCS
jgi:N-acetylneuraminate lyase